MGEQIELRDERKTLSRVSQADGAWLLVGTRRFGRVLDPDLNGIGTGLGHLRSSSLEDSSPERLELGPGHTIWEGTDRWISYSWITPDQAK